LADIKEIYSDIYLKLGTAGMRSVRLQRGKNPTKRISNHSWGIAIDLTIDGLLDPYKDDKAQYGLAIITPIFNKHRWYWGGAYKPGKDNKGRLYSKEDAMHFEVSREMLLEWAQLGYLGLNTKNVATGKLTRKRMRGIHPADNNQGVMTPSNKLELSSNSFKSPTPKLIVEPWLNWFGITTNCATKCAIDWTRSWFRY